MRVGRKDWKEIREVKMTEGMYRILDKKWIIKRREKLVKLAGIIHACKIYLLEIK